MRLFCTTLLFTAVSIIIFDSCFTYDGSYYFFNVLTQGTFFYPHERYINILVQLPVVVYLSLYNSLPIGKVLFSLCYIAIPASALYSSYRTLEKEGRRELFIWPFFGIIIASIPFGFNFGSEGMQALQLWWPIFILFLVAKQIPLLQCSLFLVLLLMTNHLFMLPVIALSIVVLVLAAIAHSDVPRINRRILVITLMLAVASLEKFFLLAPRDKEFSRNGFDIFSFAFHHISAHLSLSSVTLLLLFTLTIRLKHHFDQNIWLYKLLATTSFILAMAVALIWISDPYQWVDMNEYRLIYLPVSLLIYLIAGVDIIYSRTASNTLPTYPLNALALLFLSISIFQGVWWNQFATTLSSIMEKSPTRCIAISDHEVLHDTPLHHWSVTPYSLLLQSRRITHIAHESCNGVIQDQGVIIADWEKPRLRDQWFDYSTLLIEK